VYGNVTHMREDVTCNPISINGIVKYLNEKIISNYCLANCIKYTFLRLYNTYAGNDTFSVLYKLWKAAHHDETFTLNNDGLSQRDFIHVEDVAYMIMKIIEVEPNETCINIGSGKAVKIYDLFQIVKKNYPKLKVKNTFTNEIEYARADTTRLFNIVSHDLHNVFSYTERI
jgi:nucleoside-diphosphate-sugar epimerase